jgi:putative ABC transport system substrate-binding protein
MELSGTRYSQFREASTRRHSRRQVLQGSLALAGFSLLSGCERTGQQAAKVPRIGFLAVGSREGRAFMIEGFLQGLREHGYVEGQNIVIEYRFSENRNDRLPELAAELVALKVALIVASGTPASFAAKQATSTIPIVMGGLAANPIETGLVASLARPGGNVTGMSLMSSQLSGKRLELLKEIVPELARVAVFWNPPNPAYGPILKELETSAPTLGLKLQRLEVRVAGDLEGTFKAATRQRAGALIAPGDPLVANRPRMVADLALKYRLPTTMDMKEFVEAGGLLSLGRTSSIRTGGRQPTWTRS